MATLPKSANLCVPQYLLKGKYGIAVSNTQVFPTISGDILELHKLARVVSDIRTNELDRCRSNFVERCIEPAYGREKFRIIVKVLGKSIAPSGISLPIPRFKKAFRLFKEPQHGIVSEIS